MKITNEIKQEITHQLEFSSTTTSFISAVAGIAKRHARPIKKSSELSIEKLALELRNKNADLRLSVKALMEEWGAKSMRRRDNRIHILLERQDISSLYRTFFCSR